MLGALYAHAHTHTETESADDSTNTLRVGDNPSLELGNVSAAWLRDLMVANTWVVVERDRVQSPREC